MSSRKHEAHHYAVLSSLLLHSPSCTQTSFPVICLWTSRGSDRPSFIPTHNMQIYCSVYLNSVFPRNIWQDKKILDQAVADVTCNLSLISSCVQFWFLSVVPSILTSHIFEKFIIHLYVVIFPAFCSWDMNISYSVQTMQLYTTYNTFGFQTVLHCNTVLLLYMTLYVVLCHVQHSVRLSHTVIVSCSNLLLQCMQVCVGIAWVWSSRVFSVGFL